ncbi:putative endonuclease lcl3 [Thoreauomyces humboldtii]|nr:putative endonuclease lcl3 [Thoreauomyces humboldtii]
MTIISPKDLGLDGWTWEQVGIYAAGPAVLLSAVTIRPRYWRRYATSDYVTPDVISKGLRMTGRCVAVRDNDNFRFLHRPLWHRLLRFPMPKVLKDQTIHVRLAGIDAPEGSHFGMKMQAGHEESKAWLTSRILTKKVWITPLRRDQYGRLVCTVERRSWGIRRNVSLEMLQSGWATVYTSAGAEYGGNLEAFKAAERKARAAKKGMWAFKAPYVSPAEHKKAFRKS